MKAAREEPKALRTCLQTRHSEAFRGIQRHSGPSMPQTRLLAAFNLIDAATTTITNRSKALLSLAFSAAS
jgi:hypothetical protein